MERRREEGEKKSCLDVDGIVGVNVNVNVNFNVIITCSCFLWMVDGGWWMVDGEELIFCAWGLGDWRVEERM